MYIIVCLCIVIEKQNKMQVEMHRDAGKGPLGQCAVRSQLIFRLDPMFIGVNSKGFGESAQCILAFACLHKSMLCATSNNCYIGKAHEILVLIVHVSEKPQMLTYPKWIYRGGTGHISF